MNRSIWQKEIGHLLLTLALLMAFLLYHTIAIFNFDGAVICVGEDGHLAIETIDANQHRIAEPFTAAPEITGLALVADDCQDVPIPQMISATFLPGKNNHLAMPPAGELMLDWDVRLFPHWQSPYTDNPIFFYKQAHLTVLTTVLLI